MKKIKRSEEEISTLLDKIEKKVEEGLTQLEACEALGVSKQTYYGWKTKAKKKKRAYTSRKKIQHDTIVIKEGEPKSFQKIRLLLQLAVDELNNLEH